MTGQSIFGTAARLLPLQAIFRGGEAVLPLLLAAWLGRNAETDLYYVLAAYFVFAAALLSAAFQDSALVPVLVEVASSRPQDLAGVAGSLLGHTLVVGAAIAAAMGAIAAGVAMAVSHLPALALKLIALMSLGLVATGVRSFHVGLLNARGVFHAHPVAGGMATCVTIPLLYFGRHGFGVCIVPIALAAGEIVAIAVLRFGFCARGLGLRIRPTLERPEPVRRIFSLVRLEAAGQVITRVNPVIDQLMSRMAGVVGGGTLLRYATDVASLPTSILQATVLPVYLTHISEEAADPERFSATLRRTIAIASALLAVIAVALAAARGPLCRLLFLHGAMDAAGVRAIADVLPWALVGVVPFGALLLLARAHVALQNSRIMPSMGIVNSVLNVALNALLVRPLGLAGIALSTSMTYVVVALVFWIRLPRRAR